MLHPVVYDYPPVLNFPAAVAAAVAAAAVPDADVYPRHSAGIPVAAENLMAARQQNLYWHSPVVALIAAYASVVGTAGANPRPTAHATAAPRPVPHLLFQIPRQYQLPVIYSLASARLYQHVRLTAADSSRHYSAMDGKVCHQAGSSPTT